MADREGFAGVKHGKIKSMIFMAIYNLPVNADSETHASESQANLRTQPDPPHVSSHR